MHEVIADFFSLQQSLVAIRQSAFNFDTRGHIAEGDECCAIGQRCGCAINGAAILAGEATRKAGAGIMQARDKRA